MPHRALNLLASSMEARRYAFSCDFHSRFCRFKNTLKCTRADSALLQVVQARHFQGSSVTPLGHMQTFRPGPAHSQAVPQHNISSSAARRCAAPASCQAVGVQLPLPASPTTGLLLQLVLHLLAYPGQCLLLLSQRVAAQLQVSHNAAAADKRCLLGCDALPISALQQAAGKNQSV